MTIKFYCQHCDQRLSVPDTKAGKSVSCPACHCQISIPLKSVPRHTEPGSKTPNTPLSNQSQTDEPDTSHEEEQLLNDLDYLGSLGDSWNEILEGDFEADAQEENKSEGEAEVLDETVTPQTEKTDLQSLPPADTTQEAGAPEREQKPASNDSASTSNEMTTDSPTEQKAEPASAMTAWEDDEDEDDDEDDSFSIRSAESEFDEMDLTPMVDVTFLLLIFFMITASFSLQKSIQVPPPNPDEDGVSQSLQTLDDFREESIIVEIDNNNGIYVDDIKIANPSDITQAILDRRDQGGKPKSELVLSAHKAARHETVVAVVDAANEVGMQKIRLASYRGPED